MMRIAVCTLIRAAKRRPPVGDVPLCPAAVSKNKLRRPPRPEMDKRLPRGPFLGQCLPSQSRVGDAGKLVACLWPRPSFSLKRSIPVVSWQTILKQFFFAADRENELVRRPL